MREVNEQRLRRTLPDPSPRPRLAAPTLLALGMLVTSVALVIVTALYMRDNREYLTMLRETITSVIAVDLGSQDGRVEAAVRNGGKSSVLGKLEYVLLYQYVAERDKQYVPYHHVASYGTQAHGPFLIAPGETMTYKIDEELAYFPDAPYPDRTQMCGIGLLDLVEQMWLYIHDPAQVSVDPTNPLWAYDTSPMDCGRLVVALEVSVFRQTVAAKSTLAATLELLSGRSLKC